MSATKTAEILPFRPRRALSLEGTHQEPLEDLVADILDLARRFEDSGFSATASLMVGAAYGLTDHPGPGGGGNCARRA